jgi:hypothetical protein
VRISSHQLPLPPAEPDDDAHSDRGHPREHGCFRCCRRRRRGGHLGASTGRSAVCASPFFPHGQRPIYILRTLVTSHMRASRSGPTPTPPPHCGGRLAAATRRRWRLCWMRTSRMLTSVRLMGVDLSGASSSRRQVIIPVSVQFVTAERTRPRPCGTGGLTSTRTKRPSRSCKRKGSTRTPRTAVRVWWWTVFGRSARSWRLCMLTPA